MLIPQPPSPGLCLILHGLPKRRPDGGRDATLPTTTGAARSIRRAWPEPVFARAGAAALEQAKFEWRIKFRFVSFAFIGLIFPARFFELSTFAFQFVFSRALSRANSCASTQTPLRRPSSLRSLALVPLCVCVSLSISLHFLCSLIALCTLARNFRPRKPNYSKQPKARANFMGTQRVTSIKKHSFRPLDWNQFGDGQPVAFVADQMAGRKCCPARLASKRRQPSATSIQ